MEEDQELCSFCYHDSHFGNCDECECPRDTIPMDQWESWLKERNQRAYGIYEAPTPLQLGRIYNFPGDKHQYKLVKVEEEIGKTIQAKFEVSHENR